MNDDEDLRPDRVDTGADLRPNEVDAAAPSAAAGPRTVAADPSDDAAAQPDLAFTPLIRQLLGIVAILLVGSMLVSSLPSSELRERFRTVERPITDVTGLSQNWALFAPVPRSTVLRLRAEIERADGTVTEWTPPVGDRVIGVYRTYRWRKWANGVVDPDASRLHRGAAHHLRARFEDAHPSPIVEIRLYRGTYRQARPGSGLPADRDPPFEEELLLQVTTPVEDAEGGS